MAELKLSWGKCSIKIDNKGVPTPVEGSTELTVTKGDKTEAKIEGGEVEAVRYQASTYQLTFKVRKAPGRVFPVTAVNGLVAGEHTLSLVPEDSTAVGFNLARSVISVDDTFTAAEGAMWEVTVDALAPIDGSGSTVEWTNVAGQSDT